MEDKMGVSRSTYEEMKNAYNILVCTKLKKERKALGKRRRTKDDILKRILKILECGVGDDLTATG
jgi:hypothetical protein